MMKGLWTPPACTAKMRLSRLGGERAGCDPTGGLNVFAVEAALSLGARIVWLPTVHSSVDFGHFPTGERWKALGPIPVSDDAGNLPPLSTRSSTW
jgi:hypothetical protein